MKSYLEIADRVFERGEAIREENRKRKKRIITLSTSFLACFVLGTAIWAALESGIVYKKEPFSTDKETAFTEQFSTENELSDNNDILKKDEAVIENEYFSPFSEENVKTPENDSFYASEVSPELSEMREGAEKKDSIDYAQNSSSVSESANGRSDYDKTKNSFNTAVGTENKDKMYIVIIELYYENEPVYDLTVLESERTRLIEEGLQTEIITDGDRKVLSAKMTLSEMERFNFISFDGSVVNIDGFGYVAKIIDQ